MRKLVMLLLPLLLIEMLVQLGIGLLFVLLMGMLEIP